jgi:hypothetical protein
MKRTLSSSFMLLVSLVSLFARVYGASYSAFDNDGELRVALESWVNNDTVQVIAKYGTIDTWNVSLITDFKGIFCGLDVGMDCLALLFILFRWCCRIAQTHVMVPTFQAFSRITLPSMRISVIGTHKVSQTWIVFSCKNLC